MFHVFFPSRNGPCCCRCCCCSIVLFFSLNNINVNKSITYGREGKGKSSELKVMVGWVPRGQWLLLLFLLFSLPSPFIYYLL